MLDWGIGRPLGLHPSVRVMEVLVGDVRPGLTLDPRYSDVGGQHRLKPTQHRDFMRRRTLTLVDAETIPTRQGPTSADIVAQVY